MEKKTNRLVFLLENLVLLCLKILKKKKTFKMLPSDTGFGLMLVSFFLSWYFIHLLIQKYYTISHRRQQFETRFLCVCGCVFVVGINVHLQRLEYSDWMRFVTASLVLSSFLLLCTEPPCVDQNLLVFARQNHEKPPKRFFLMYHFILP